MMITVPTTNIPSFNFIVENALARSRHKKVSFLESGERSKGGNGANCTR